MRAKRRGTIVGLAALALALAIFSITAIQTGILISEATAQSEAPANDPVLEALKPDGGPVQTLAGGSVRPPADAPAPNAPSEPGISREVQLMEEMNAAKAATSLANQGPNSNSEFWSQIRHGGTGTVSIPDQKSAVLVQDFGAEWERMRSAEGELFTWGGYALAGIMAVLVLFYLLRGRIKIEHGRSAEKIERFKNYERFGHWLLAGSFILLAITGLNLLYGKDLLMPIIGKEAFASLSLAGKWIHNNVAWAFMLGLVMVFVMWVVHNIPSYIDLIWIAKGGGLFSKGVHPPSRKFNAGQKLIFWSTILLGGSVSASGISLLFPYELPMFAKTFVVLNDLGISALVMGAPLPTNLSVVQEMQYAQVWHTIVALAMIVIIVAHIYIGSLGMEGAFDAMGSGMVDRNWAIEHHGLWVEEVEGRRGGGGSHGGAHATPAE